MPPVILQLGEPGNALYYSEGNVISITVPIGNYNYVKNLKMYIASESAFDGTAVMLSKLIYLGTYVLLNFKV